MEVINRAVPGLRAFSLGLTVGVGAMYFGLFLVSADTDTIEPNADGTGVAGTAVGCTSSLRWECLNDGILESDVTNPDTSTDYLQLQNNQVNHSQLETFGDVDTATSATIWIYHRDGGSNAFIEVGLYAANETTVIGTPTSIPSQTSAGWSSVTYNSLTLSQADLDGMRLRVSCLKTGGGKSNDCFVYAAYVEVQYSPLIEVTVGSAGSQQNLDIGSTNVHVGGTFTVTENVSSRSVTSIAIEEIGSVDASTNLKNVKLLYDLDTTGGDGYNCSDQSLNGDELQFGATSTSGFSGPDGTITFTDSETISTTATLCLYPVLDIATTSAAGETIEIQINDPTVDVVATGAPDINPNTTIALTGTTIIQAQERTQTHYHWRNDDGNENDPGGASSATGGTDDTTLDTLGKESPIRLRLQVSNEGNRTSDATQYRLEYGRKISTCGNVANDSSWVDVDDVGGDWDMSLSSNLIEGNDTTDIAESIGGMPNENLTFLSTNGGQKESSSQTGSLTLTSTQFVELEYSIISTANATEGFTYCFRLTDAGSDLEVYTVYPEATILADVNVNSSGLQKATVDIPTTGVEAGATFVVTDNIAGDTTVQSITITASSTGSVDADFEDIQLWYDLDTTGGDGYDCSDQSYTGGGSETQFGSTATTFSGGSATFSGSQIINPTQTMCVYVIYTASSTITDGEKIDFRIDDASTDVTINAGTVSPAAQVQMSGTTEFVKAIPTVVHYHWRNDDGNETGATSATAGSEDTLLEELRRTNPIRLRIGVANEGSSSTPTFAYRLEWALKVTTCEQADDWVDVGATNDAFNMFNSTNITDGNDTTNIPVSNGGVTDVGDTYFTNNNAVKDTSSQVAAFALPGKNYTDLEFSIVASSTATEGASYCFRVTDAGDGTVLTYDVYPEVSIKPKTDFFIQRGVTTVSGTGATITAGTDYIAPSASSSAFIRIVGTHNTGAGSPTNTTGNADDVTVHVSNPGNITNNITFTRPGTAVDSTRVAWEIIEYVGGPGGANEMIVREQAAATYGGGNTTLTTGAVSSIANDADVAVFITGQSNPDTATNYARGISTAAWNSGADTATFTRGESGNAAIVSYAVVEFTGNNWVVQRSEHSYTAAGTPETETITAVNSLTRSFLHAQKRIGAGLTGHSNFGHTVYLSGLTQATFALDNGATSPGSHTSVAWIIENTQTVGDTMVVTRSNNSESAGTGPKTVNVNINTSISNPQDASLFINNFGDEANGGSGQNTFPEPIYSAEIISDTQYQLYVADPGGDTRSWRAEVVEWPTAARDITQNDYRFYAYENVLDPTDPWPAGATDIGENFEVTVDDGPIALKDSFRLRMSLRITTAVMEPGIDNFKLQYGERDTTCSAIGESDWHDVGAIGSTTALWRGTTTTQVDGTALSTDPPAAGDLNLAVSDVAGTYEEENPTALTPYAVNPGEDVEFDWVVQNHLATEKTSYCFRMVEGDGTLLLGWNSYPTMRTAGYTPIQTQWQWFDDETSLTPSVSLAGENTAPADIAFDNTIKLRTTIAEQTGGVGENIKFKLQYSEFSDFSQAVFDVATSGACVTASTTDAQLWCYDDGAGVDNAVIDAAVLSDADACTAGSGAGCGTHNEDMSTTTATYDQLAFSTAEYEFTLRHDGARASAVYYFRLFDVTNATSVVASTSYPSVVTAGAALNFGLSGLNAGEVIDGETIDVSSATTAIPFVDVPFNTEYTAGYRVNINTNATEGYKVLMLFDQDPTGAYGSVLEPITGTNAVPVSWSAGCDLTASSCFGYHVEDDILEGGSTRFGADDSWAAISTTVAEEVMYSSVPAEDQHDIVFKLQISEDQPPGEYEANITLISIPIF